MLNLSKILKVSVLSCILALPALASSSKSDPIPGAKGQKVRVSMARDDAKARPLIELNGFRLKLPKGESTIVQYTGDTRISVDEAYDIEGLTSFPVTITQYISGFMDENGIVAPWRGYENVVCKSEKINDMTEVEAVQIRWSSEGTCQLYYKQKAPKTSP